MKTKELSELKKRIRSKMDTAYHNISSSILRMEDRHTDDKYMDTYEYQQHMGTILVNRGKEEMGVDILKIIEDIEKEGIPESPKLSLEKQLEKIRIEENNILQKILAEKRSHELAQKSKKIRPKHRLEEIEELLD